MLHGTADTAIHSKSASVLTHKANLLVAEGAIELVLLAVPHCNPSRDMDAGCRVAPPCACTQSSSNCCCLVPAPADSQPGHEAVSAG